MILQALNEYYERKSKLQDSGLPPLGFEWKELPFLIVIGEKGQFIDIEDTREKEEKKNKTKSFLVPQSVKKSVNIAANYFWGAIGYALGKDNKSKPKRLLEMHQAFLDLIQSSFPNPQEEKGVNALWLFLNSSNKTETFKHPLWKEMLEISPFISFRLQSENLLICQREKVREAWQNKNQAELAKKQLCLVTGNYGEIERIHPSIKGVRGAQSSGADIVSYNKPAFTSFNKEQGDNAPISQLAAFCYTTSLNYLLRKNSPQKLQIGDATTVFWADKEHRTETLLSELFEESPDDPDRNARAVESLYSSPHTGALPLEEDNTKFYVLGLSPNAARLSVRFWHVTTVADLAKNIKQHFEDISIIHSPQEKKVLSLFRLLVNTAALGKSENIIPNLSGETMRSILQGTPYPRTLLQQVLIRCRAEQSSSEKNVNYPRAALIKGCLNRIIRNFQPQEKEITVSLDTSNHNTGYLLGRLFAALEKIQEETHPGINATIRDRYYGAASVRPSMVFSSLLKLKNHHVSKLEHQGRKVFFEKLCGEIIDGIKNNFPSVLNLEDQGRFAIGYYHQRQEFFKKHETEEKGE